jgi:hypothetical protein
LEVQQGVKERIKKSTRNTGSQKLERNIQTASLGALNTQRGKYKPKEASDRMINKTLSLEQTLIKRGLTNRLICATLNTNLNCSKGEILNLYHNQLVAPSKKPGCYCPAVRK